MKRDPERNGMPSTKKKLKGGKIAGRIGSKAGVKLTPYAGKAALRLGKAEMKLLRAAMRSREPRSSRYLKYGLFLTVGLALGALIKGVKKPVERKLHDDDPTTGSGPRPGGGGGFVSTTVVPEEQETVEQRIRSALGQDERTRNIPRPNVTVNDGVAELRGPVSDKATRSAAEEIAQNVEGVQEVRNLLVVV
ncbi:BON domain-containing protein [Rubrobacter indicoceani]|uniref:BON domain-containing protein n=1 Tax=Rubrobacter indicoceani TaxID=2051957 RepID=UPI0013C4CB03|nr:BON domain-containing protein [Rubrobacter indicoceani]